MIVSSHPLTLTMETSPPPSYTFPALFPSGESLGVSRDKVWGKLRQAPKQVPGAGSGQAARVDIVVAVRKVAELCPTA